MLWVLEGESKRLNAPCRWLSSIHSPPHPTPPPLVTCTSCLEQPEEFKTLRAHDRQEKVTQRTFPSLVKREPLLEIAFCRQMKGH